MTNKQAIEQEPCEDYISREKVCDYIAEFTNNEYRTQSECDMVDAMIEGIKYLPSIKQMPKKDELKQHLYELSLALDMYSAGKDYINLRKTHYNNIEWLQKKGLTEEYYKVLFAHIRGESGAEE